MTTQRERRTGVGVK